MRICLTDEADPIRIGDNVRHKSLDGWLVVTQITPDGIAWCAVQDGEQVGWLAVHFVRDLVKIRPLH
jgi:hypothetical protein